MTMKKTNKYKTIFFDLDGTLVLENFNLFITLYISSMTNFLSNKDYQNPLDLATLILKSERSIVNNNGKKLNKEAFWDFIEQNIKLDHEKFENDLNEYYEKKLYKSLKPCSTPNQDMQDIVKYLKEKSYQLVLTTNSVFPQIANEQRLKWNNINIEDFSYVTNYDNSYFAKPNPKYYQEVLDKLNLNNKEVLMIGNDEITDAAAQKCGIDFYLTTDNILNEGSSNPTYKGTIKDLKEFIMKNF